MTRLLICVAILHALPIELKALLFPPSSPLGLVYSVSVPVVEYFPERRLLIDWCFVMAYTTPNNLDIFYNVPIWPGKFTNKITRREIVPEQGQVDRQLELYRKYDRRTDENRHVKDLSAGELYRSMEDFLVSYGYHETCLLRSVCELAQHPFADWQQNILTDIVTFLLTPSLHDGFDATEQLYRESYEQAEQHGFYGENCTALYADCQRNFFDLLTKVIFSNG